MNRLTLALSLVALCLCAAGTTHATKVLPTPDRPAALVKAHVLPSNAVHGAIYTDVSLDAIKKPNFDKTSRNVDQSLKNAVFRRDGYDPEKINTGDFEIDHLIPVSIGGASTIDNLWTQSYVSQPLNAHTKDRLEVRLLKLVRDGKVPLAQAQREIAADWTKAYVKYVGPLPTDKTQPPAKKHEDD